MLMDAFRNSYREKIKEQLQSAGYVVAMSVPENDINALRTAADFGGEAYSRLCRTMERAFPMDVEFFHSAYCNILRLNDDMTEGFGVAYLDQSIGTYFPLDDVETEEVRQVYSEGRPVWNSAVEDVSGTYLSVKLPIIREGGKVVGAVAVGSETYIIDEMLDSMQKQIILAITAVILLIWIASGETSSFIAGCSAYLQARERLGRNALPAHMVRLLVFAVFTAYNMSSAFLPVYVMHRSEVLPEAWRSLGATLPLTVNIFMTGVMSLFCADFIRKLGVRRMFALSMACSMAGNMMLFILPGYAAIMAGLLIDGIGV